MKFEIKHGLSGAVLFAIETETLKLCVEVAVNQKANLSDADLCGADLRGAYLCDAYLSGANLCGANLSDADLSGANLCGANLSDADLCGANLRGAYLCDAHLSGADLCGANLSDADLCGANLCDADLCGANLVADLGQPNGWHAYTEGTKGEQRVQVGCRNFTIAEGRAYWAGKENRREVLAALDYAEVIGKMRGWIK